MVCFADLVWITAVWWFVLIVGAVFCCLLVVCLTGLLFALVVGVYGCLFGLLGLAGLGGFASLVCACGFRWVWASWVA